MFYYIEILRGRVVRAVIQPNLSKPEPLFNGRIRQLTKRQYTILERNRFTLEGIEIGDNPEISLMADLIQLDGSRST